MPATQTVVERRIAELRRLKSEGFPIEFLSRWHVKVGPLHAWIAAGRWYNAATGERGRIGKRTMRDLLVPIWEPVIARGRHLCPEQEHYARQERRRHQEFLKQHQDYMKRLARWRFGYVPKASR